MQREVIIQPGLPDAKTLVRWIGEVKSVRHLRKRWIVLFGIGTIALSLLFMWGFLHLILVLVFPKPVIAH